MARNVPASVKVAACRVTNRDKGNLSLQRMNLVVAQYWRRRFRVEISDEGLNIDTTKDPVLKRRVSRAGVRWQARLKTLKESLRLRDGMAFALTSSMARWFCRKLV
jgi:hypothetical protein